MIVVIDVCGVLTSSKDSKEPKEFSPKPSEALIWDKALGLITTCQGRLEKDQAGCELKTRNKITSNSVKLCLNRDSTQETWRM